MAKYYIMAGKNTQALGAASLRARIHGEYLGHSTYSLDKNTYCNMYLEYYFPFLLPDFSTHLFKKTNFVCQNATYLAN